MSWMQIIGLILVAPGLIAIAAIGAIILALAAVTIYQESKFMALAVLAFLVGFVLIQAG